MRIVVQLHFQSKGYYVFFFNDTATTEIYPLSLHDALPILLEIAIWGRPFRSGTPDYRGWQRARGDRCAAGLDNPASQNGRDRESTRLNSSHTAISYAVFCLNKNKLRISSSELDADAEHPRV